MEHHTPLHEPGGSDSQVMLTCLIQSIESEQEVRQVGAELCQAQINFSGV